MTAGVASYSFYLDGTSVADLDYPAARRALPADATAVHLGSLGLLMEPVGTSTERLLADVPAGTLVLLDPNCRPGAVADHDAFRKRVGVFAPPRRHRQGERGGPGLPVPRRAPRGGGRHPARGRPVARPRHRRPGTRPARSCPAPSSPNRSPSSPSSTRSARVTRSAAASSPGGRRTASAGRTCATRNWPGARSAPPPRSRPSPAPARARTRRPAPTCRHGTGGPSRGRRTVTPSRRRSG